MHCNHCFLLVAVIIFFVCWTPYHLERVVFVFVTITKNWTPGMNKFQSILHLVSGNNNLTFVTFQVQPRIMLTDPSRLLLLSVFGLEPHHVQPHVQAFPPRLPRPVRRRTTRALATADTLHVRLQPNGAPGCSGGTAKRALDPDVPSYRSLSRKQHVGVFSSSQLPIHQGPIHQIREK